MNDRLFSEEATVVRQYRELLQAKPSEDSKDYRTALSILAEKYQDLLEQTKFLTRISDRLENRLQLSNQALAEKNNELKQTLAELTRARVSKSAITIIYVIAACLFVFEEYFIEPFLGFMGNIMVYGIAIKLAIALLLKPAENILERVLLKQLTKRRPNG